MKAFYSDTFVFPLPEGHRFPIQKYSRLREHILASGIIPPENVFIPEAATDEQILRAHNADYLHALKEGLLSTKEIRRLGFPWSPELLERARRSSGGTIAACRAALTEGVAVNLAGGTHHACPDHGEGFCVLNDSAIAARAMQAEGRVKRVIIIDCDVHQGNGTAAIMAGDPTVFTFSIHGEHNFPFRKIPGDMDIGLEDDTQDTIYLDMLEVGVEHALALSHANLAIYLAGADPYADDRLGHLSLSMAGLEARDRLVFDLCQQYGVPIAVVMAGGYAKNISDIVAIHYQTIQVATEYVKT